MFLEPTECCRIGKENADKILESITRRFVERLSIGTPGSLLVKAKDVQERLSQEVLVALISERSVRLRLPPGIIFVLDNLQPHSQQRFLIASTVHDKTAHGYPVYPGHNIMLQGIFTLISHI